MEPYFLARPFPVNTIAAKIETVSGFDALILKPVEW
jgi:hypothetical protein